MPKPPLKWNEALLRANINYMWTHIL